MEPQRTARHAEEREFSRDVTGLPSATATQIVDLADGDTYHLRAAPIRKQIGSAEVRLLAYNGSVPGPTLRVRQGSTVTVSFTNQGDLESTVHWHGLRLENRFDGTHETQRPVPIGGSFIYRLHFPDPGVYWYHPHIREDYGQELGLYGNVLVVPAEPDYWPPAHREVLLTLDDILVEDGKVAPFKRHGTSFTAMGRYGNVYLVGGEPHQSLPAQLGEVVRLYLTNTANARVFNVGLPRARMKLVGGDSGRSEREEFVQAVILSPSERAVVDVLLDEPGQIALEHSTPDRSTALATFAVSEDRAEPPLAEEFEILRDSPELARERERLAPCLTAAPDKTLAFVAEMKLSGREGAPGQVVYACPMHPKVISQEPGRCPECGMNLVAKEAPEAASAYTCPMHPEVVSDQPGSCSKCGMRLVPSQPEQQTAHGSEPHDPMEHTAARHASSSHQEGEALPAPGPSDGIEWEDEMVAFNRMTTPANMRWKLVDRETGAANLSIHWRFRVGDRVKIRLLNEMDSDHPMHHPFHVHGAGRFLVLSRDGVVEQNLMWKDTVLVRTGQTVDILLDVTNPGVWMAHCHIAEHHEGGMMLHFQVDE